MHIILYDNTDIDKTNSHIYNIDKKAQIYIVLNNANIHQDSITLFKQYNNLSLFKLSSDQSEIDLNNLFKLTPRDWPDVHLYFHNKLTILKTYKYTINYIYGLWDITPLSTQFQKNIDNMSQKCISCKHHVYLKPDIYKFFNLEVLSAISSVPRKVCIADIARYVLNYNYGGFYLDLDIFVKEDLTKLLDDEFDIILFVEHEKCNVHHMGARENKEFTLRIFNCIFWSIPNHSFWTDCINLCIQRLNTKNIKWTDEDVLWATGPDVITTIWHQKYKNDKRIKIVHFNENTTFFNHQTSGSWRKNKDA